MNKGSSIINKEAGRIIKEAIKKHPKTQILIADDIGISTKQLRNYSEGVFPKYKKDNVIAIDNYFNIKVVDIIYKMELLEEINVPHEKNREDIAPTYLEQRRYGKIVGEDFFVPLVRQAARAGYSKSYENVDYLNDLETFQMPPGIRHKGFDWRWFEVGGTSMNPVLTDGDYILCSLIGEADWIDAIRADEFKIFVIVWRNDVSVKRVVMNSGDFILISENEEEEKQKRVSVNDVKEIWKVRRRLTAQLPPTKRFKITV
jgi:phage repressor protein C with HTH and peptisase S24 domain